MVDFDNTHENKVKNQLIQKAELMKKRPYRRWSANFGMIASLGGVIIVPILLCLWFGSYLDGVFSQHFSWRLSFLFIGFIWGFVNAYFWIKLENDKISHIGEDDE